MRAGSCCAPVSRDLTDLLSTLRSASHSRFVAANDGFGARRTRYTAAMEAASHTEVLTGPLVADQDADRFPETTAEKWE